MSDQSSERTEISSRTAAIAANEHGAIGVCLFVTAAELEALDIDPATQSTVSYRVVRQENTLKIAPEE